MKDSLIALARDALHSLRNLLPIVVVISVFQVFVFRASVSGLMSMAIGGFLVVAGLAFFIFGLRLALFPIGEGLAYSLARKGSVFWLIVFAFALGFGTTAFRPPTFSPRPGATAGDGLWRGRRDAGRRIRAHERIPESL